MRNAKRPRIDQSYDMAHRVCTAHADDMHGISHAHSWHAQQPTQALALQRLLDDVGWHHHVEYRSVEVDKTTKLNTRMSVVSVRLVGGR